MSDEQKAALIEMAQFLKLPERMNMDAEQCVETLLNAEIARQLTERINEDGIDRKNTQN